MARELLLLSGGAIIAKPQSIYMKVKSRAEMRETLPKDLAWHPLFHGNLLERRKINSQADLFMPRLLPIPDRHGFQPEVVPFPVARLAVGCAVTAAGLIFRKHLSKLCLASLALRLIGAAASCGTIPMAI